MFIYVVSIGLDGPALSAFESLEEAKRAVGHWVTFYDGTPPMEFVEKTRHARRHWIYNDDRHVITEIFLKKGSKCVQSDTT